MRRETCVGCERPFNELEVTSALRRTIYVDGKLSYICLKCERMALAEWVKQRRSEHERHD